ncbi:hypothetical protein MSWHS_1283 [Methanosarcina sp. WWM596]|nr:hypothetical protein MSWHS_1283 [Methanosarcina sp. WWM596]
MFRSYPRGRTITDKQLRSNFSRNAPYWLRCAGVVSWLFLGIVLAASTVLNIIATVRSITVLLLFAGSDRNCLSATGRHAVRRISDDRKYWHTLRNTDHRPNHRAQIQTGESRSREELLNDATQSTSQNPCAGQAYRGNLQPGLLLLLLFGQGTALSRQQISHVRRSAGELHPAAYRSSPDPAGDCCLAGGGTYPDGNRLLSARHRTAGKVQKTGNDV